MKFHEKLQELRKQRGFTQEGLAERLYVSRTAVSKCFSVSLDAQISSDAYPGGKGGGAKGKSGSELSFRVAGLRRDSAVGPDRGGVAAVYPGSAALCGGGGPSFSGDQGPQLIKWPRP